MTDLVERARWIADTVLFPDASQVDASGVIPESHFRVMAAEGLYGVAAPAAGLEPADLVGVIEVLAGGCLATTFTWIQHHVTVIGLANTRNAGLRAQYLDDLAAGRKRSGVAFAGALADPPRLRASRVDGGWIFDGDAPFVSGWGIVDVLQLSGNAQDGIVNALVDAKGLAAQPYELVSLQATATVRLKFDKLFIPDARIIGVLPLEQFQATQHIGSRLNGALPTGLALRCARLLDEHGRAQAAAAIRGRIDEVRAALDAGMADPESLPAARAAASELAYRAAAAVVVAEGSPAVVAGGHGQRLVREALFTLVAGSRTPMKNALLDVLTSQQA
ncbi:acyl-CoA dehydrogenase family protein [Kibdelosporangium persicum]|uniref:Acyl-CoA dehydrogenase n=1 Tax=Kibdelosporangium persicum TaxID=2698649 RepID=A0ABX2EW43_9PSEU|nr:acyl-CoA dehydrogenase family protein [Kibdelosporangium persicum]NRN63202.1 Acyl-CoA dehydrogenase [Kibdelosporangium persicum]